MLYYHESINFHVVISSEVPITKFGERKKNNNKLTYSQEHNKSSSTMEYLKETWKLDEQNLYNKDWKESIEMYNKDRDMC